MPLDRLYIDHIGQAGWEEVRGRGRSLALGWSWLLCSNSYALALR